MELKIDIDMNKIDYDAINNEILKKIKELDLPNTYNIDYKIREVINESVKKNADDYIGTTWGGNLDYNSKNNINQLAKDIIRERLSIEINKLFDEMTGEELNEMIRNAVSSTLINMITNSFTSSISNIINASYIQNENRTKDLIHQTLHEVMGRY